VDKSGEEWKPMTNHIHQLTRDGLPVKKGFRTPKKLSKKQAKKVADEIKQQKYWNTEIVKKMADEVGEDGIIELGEPGGEDE
jgi:transposase